jgi:threonine synthase
MITPLESQPDLARALGIPSVYFKREDMHPLGSHKGRSIPTMIERYAAEGERKFVISSSGNAAIAAALAIEPPLEITIFVGRHIDPMKLARLRGIAAAKSCVRIEQTDNPKQRALQEAKNGAVNLRQSADDAALAGYQSLAEELSVVPGAHAVFIPTSSGTTAQALGAFLPNAQIHIVQTDAVHPIAALFDKNFTARETSIAGAIVDRIAYRKDAVAAAVRASGGSGWVVSDDDIRSAMALVQKTTGIGISPNAALAVAGLAKAIRSGWPLPPTASCIITGA